MADSRNRLINQAVLGQQVAVQASWSNWIADTTYFARITNLITGQAHNRSHDYIGGYSMNEASKTAATHRFIMQMLSGYGTAGPYPISNTATAAVQWAPPVPPGTGTPPGPSAATTCNRAGPAWGMLRE